MKINYYLSESLRAPEWVFFKKIHWVFFKTFFYTTHISHHQLQYALVNGINICQYQAFELMGDKLKNLYKADIFIKRAPFSCTIGVWFIKILLCLNKVERTVINEQSFYVSNVSVKTSSYFLLHSFIILR